MIIHDPAGMCATVADVRAARMLVIGPDARGWGRVPPGAAATPPLVLATS